MQQYFSSELVQNMYMASVPFAILMLETDEEKEFMTQLYIDHKRLIVHTAFYFFPGDKTKVHEVESDVIAALCARCKNLMCKESNELPGYIVNTTKNICRTRVKKDKPERENRDYYADEYIEKYTDSGDLYSSIFEVATSGMLIEGFEKLSERDQTLITMRHVEGLEYHEIGKRLGMKEGAARTALSRAKKQLEKLIHKGKEGEDDKTQE